MHVLAYVPWGAEGFISRVEADIRRGIPGIDITGLAEGAVREARERVRASFRNSGFDFPQDRVLINLAPAGIRKEGASLDLPIAISVMAAAGMVPPPDDIMVLGELELSGRVRPVRGVLAAVAAGLKAGIREYIVPFENSHEAAVLPNAKFFAAASLTEAVHALFLRAETGELPGSSDIENNDPGNSDSGNNNQDSSSAYKKEVADYGFPTGDFSEVRGQGRYKRAMEIKAAGGHNLLVFGSPGSGKTMLARRFPSILPLLTPEEAVEVTRLHSLAGQIKADNASWDGLIKQPPFRSPHHSASAEGVLGGGRTVRPGEITLAHYGVLFFDEAPKFRISVLQALREPLEDRVITVVRAEGPMKLPADFQLIMAANCCPCGRLGISNSNGSGEYFESGCFCSTEEVHKYWRKFGSALLDRIELRVPVHTPGVLTPGSVKEEGSAAILKRVRAAVEIQRERFRSSQVRRNARMPPDMIEKFCVLSPKAERAFTLAASKLALSGRACHGILKISRTIADLEGSDSIDAVHILEAVQHRRLGDDPYDILSAEE